MARTPTIPSHLQRTLRTPFPEKSWEYKWMENPEYHKGDAVMGTIMAVGGCILAGFVLALLGSAFLPLVGELVLFLLPGVVTPVYAAWRIRRYRRARTIVPKSVISSYKSTQDRARKNVEFLKKGLHKKASPEAQGIARAGLELAGEYDDMAEQWAKVIWADPLAPEGGPMREATFALARSVQEHREALEKRLAWDQQMQDEVNAPFVQDVNLLAREALASTEAARQRLQDDSADIDARQAALTSLKSLSTDSTRKSLYL